MIRQKETDMEPKNIILISMISETFSTDIKVFSHFPDGTLLAEEASAVPITLTA